MGPSATACNSCTRKSTVQKERERERDGSAITPAAVLLCGRAIEKRGPVHWPANCVAGASAELARKATSYVESRHASTPACQRANMPVSQLLCR